MFLNNNIKIFFSSFLKEFSSQKYTKFQKYLQKTSRSVVRKQYILVKI